VNLEGSLINQSLINIIKIHEYSKYFISKKLITNKLKNMLIYCNVVVGKDVDVATVCKSFSLEM